MQRSDAVLLGRDYSAREFSPQELDQYQRQFPNEAPVQALGRYIGYPTNPKCISHYPGAYKAHWEAGRPVFLFHQIGYTDMGGGYDAGRYHAQVAVSDARSIRVGWNGESPIVACMDRYYVKQGYATLTREQLRSYMEGFRSVLGWELSGFYGFYDSMRHCIEENWANFTIQCGARSDHVPGIHAWQENNYQPKILGTATDILEIYKNPFGDKMTWEQFLEYMTRWWRFHSRPNGGRPTWEDGPTAPEMLAAIASKQLVIDVDEAEFVSELKKQGVDLSPDVDVSALKRAFAEVLAKTLTPAAEAADEQAQPPASDS